MSIDVKLRKWTSFDDDRRRLNVEYRRLLLKIVVEFFENFNNFQNRRKSSKIVKNCQFQRN